MMWHELVNRCEIVIDLDKAEDNALRASEERMDKALDNIKKLLDKNNKKK